MPEKLPAITFPQLQAIAAPPEEGEDLDTSGLFIGPIAEQYLRQFASQQEVDKTFGFMIRTENSTSVTALLK